MGACSIAVSGDPTAVAFGAIAGEAGIVLSLFFTPSAAVPPSAGLLELGGARPARELAGVVAGLVLLVVGLRACLVGLATPVRPDTGFLSLAPETPIVDLLSVDGAAAFCAVNRAEVEGVIETLLAFVGRSGRLFSVLGLGAALLGSSTELVEGRVL